MRLPDEIDRLITDLERGGGTFRDKSQRLRNSWYYQKVRSALLMEYPFCLMCEVNGKSTFATEMDHIVPARHRPLREFFVLQNLQALCIDCHAEKTREENETNALRFAPPDDVIVTKDGEVIRRGA